MLTPACPSLAATAGALACTMVARAGACTAAATSAPAAGQLAVFTMAPEGPPQRLVEVVLAALTLGRPLPLRPRQLASSSGSLRLLL